MSTRRCTGTDSGSKTALTAFPRKREPPIPHGGTFTYRLRFPDPGFYWYHPHIREDFAQEMGLYAGIIVEPEDPGLLAAG